MCILFTYVNEVSLQVIVRELPNTQVFTHDIGRYFAGYAGVPFDFRWVYLPFGIPLTVNVKVVPEGCFG